MKNILFVLSLALIQIACGDSSSQSETTSQPTESVASAQTVSLTAEQMQSAGIKTGQPELRALSSNLVANGTVAVLPEGRASVSSKLAGRIEQFFIHEGQNVRKGQALMSISSGALFDIQQAYLQARADVLYLEKEAERQKTLSGEQVGATKHWEEAQSKLLRAQADMQAAAAKLRYLGIGLDGLTNAAQPNFARTVVITAPLDGNITEIPVNLGSSVTEGTLLCNIVNLNDLHAHIEVFAKDIASVRPRQAAVVHFSNTSLPDLDTEVEFISQDMSPDTKTYSLHIHLPAGKGHTYLPGMPVVATITTSTSAKQTALPEAAVLHDGTASYCFIVVGSAGDRTEFKRVVFEPTSISNGWVGVPEGVLQGQAVVLRGAYLVDGEMRKGEMEE